MPALRIQGIVPVIPTPFLSDERVDWEGFAPLVDFAVAGGCSAVCLPAYASEFYKLSDEERLRTVQQAAGAARGRIPVIGQANHASAALAAKAARDVEVAGADGVAVAVPRLFGLPEDDLFRYFARILETVRIPLLIQDYNPGGPTLSPPFIAGLHRHYPHFRYIKLEEPLMAAKVKAILEATGGEVGVLEGWGGMYTLELVDAGICGVMPGLAVSDLLVRVFRLASAGRKPEAYEIFAAILPQIVFSLQNMEFYHYAEKELLGARGILRERTVRGVTLTPDPVDSSHLDFLNRQVLALVRKLDSTRTAKS